MTEKGDLDRAGVPKGALWPLLGIALVGFVLRWLHVVEMADTPLYTEAHGDGEAYLKLAKSLREDGLLRPGAVDYQAPLYPHVLALIQALFGEGLAAVRHVQSLLGGASVFLMGLGTTRLLGRRAGLAAAALLAVFAPSIWLDGLIQKSAWTGFLVSGVIALWSYVATSSGRRYAAALGAAMGLFMLTRGEARLWALGAGAALWWLGSADRDARVRVRQLGAYAGGLFLVITPVFLRNGVYGGDWVLTTSQSGPNLFIGNHAGANGSYSPLVIGRGDARYEADDARRLAEEAERRELIPSEVSAHWRGRALDDMAADPLGAFGLFGKKLLLALNNDEVADTDDLYHAQRSSLVLKLTLPFAAVFLLAVIGLVLATKEERRRLRPLLLLGGIQLAALVLFYVFARYRLPLTLAMMPAAGLGLAVLPRAKERSFGAGLPVLMALLLTFVNIWSREEGMAAALVNEGQALVEQEKYEEALGSGLRVMKLAPDFFDAHRLISLALIKLNQPQGALTYLERAYELAPGDWQVRAWLGIALGEKGDLPRAFSFLSGAALERPEALPIVSNAAALAMALKRPKDAIEILRARFNEELPSDDVSESAAAQIAAADVGLQLQLAWLLSTSEDDEVRSGVEALEVLANLQQDARSAEVRAAALAETGAFEEAAKLATNAEHRAAYAAGRPWRE